jgi:hypothetical protein
VAAGSRRLSSIFLFHKRVCGPLANSLFVRRPHTTHPASRIEAAYHKADQSIQRVIDLLAA